MTNIIHNLKECSYDPKTISSKLASIDSLEETQRKLQENVASQKQKLYEIIKEKTDAEQMLSRCKLSLGLYDQLESMQCGLKELTILRNTILEISKNNDISPYLAFKKFCNDMESQYDAKLGLQKKNDEMNASLIDAKRELHLITLECSRLKNLYDNLQELFDRGFHKVIL